MYQMNCCCHYGNQYDISGVDIKQDTIRVYEGGEACSSILGYTGTISSEELKEGMIVN